MVDKGQLECPSLFCFYLLSKPHVFLSTLYKQEDLITKAFISAKLVRVLGMRGERVSIDFPCFLPSVHSQVILCFSPKYAFYLRSITRKQISPVSGAVHSSLCLFTTRGDDRFPFAFYISQKHHHLFLISVTHSFGLSLLNYQSWISSFESLL